MLARFGLRMSILAVFAAFGSIGFGRSLAALLWMSTILSAVIGFMRREIPETIIELSREIELDTGSKPPFPAAGTPRVA
jgi:hypothetical protein